MFVSDCVEYSINIVDVAVEANTRGVDGGTLTCRSENNDHKQGDQEYFLKWDDITASTANFCDNLYTNKMKFGPGEAGSHTLASTHCVVSLTWEGGDNCPPGPDFSGVAPEVNDVIDFYNQRLAVPIDRCKFPPLHHVILESPKN